MANYTRFANDFGTQFIFQKVLGERNSSLFENSNIEIFIDPVADPIKLEKSRFMRGSYVERHLY